MLTDKQEKFAQCIADGMTQADAYRSAYPQSNMKENALYVQASRLLDNPKVRLRVQELRKAIENKQLWTREKSVRALLGAYKVAQDRNQSTGMTAAVKELNAMHGYNAAVKHEITGTIAQFNINTKKLTDEALKQILDATNPD
jgi:phage terminase small subunit